MTCRTQEEEEDTRAREVVTPARDQATQAVTPEDKEATLGAKEDILEDKEVIPEDKEAILVVKEVILVARQLEDTRVAVATLSSRPEEATSKADSGIRPSTRPRWRRYSRVATRIGQAPSQLTSCRRPSRTGHGSRSTWRLSGS